MDYNEEYYYKILGISPDATKEEVKNAIDLFGVIIEKKNVNAMGLRRDIAIKLYNQINRWYFEKFVEIEYVDRINVLDNKKTCEVFGLEKASDEELQGIIRYISKGKLSSKKNCGELLQAISDSDYDTINKYLVGKYEEELSDDQLNAIYVYAIKETVYDRNKHVVLWNNLLRNNYIEINKIRNIDNSVNKGVK